MFVTPSLTTESERRELRVLGVVVARTPLIHIFTTDVSIKEGLAEGSGSVIEPLEIGDYLTVITYKVAPVRPTRPADIVIADLGMLKDFTNGAVTAMYARIEAEAAMNE